MKKASIGSRGKVAIWLFILVILWPCRLISQTKPEEEQLLRQTFERYKQAILQEKFDVVWDLLFPGIHEILEKAYQRIKSDQEYREEFVSTNWEGISDEEVQILKLGSAKEVFIALAKKGRAAEGEEFGEGFKSGKIKKILIHEVKWIPEPKRYVGVLSLKQDLYKHFKGENPLLQAMVVYQFKNEEGEDREIYRSLIKIKGEWKFLGSPVYIWISEGEQIDPDFNLFRE